MPLPTSLGGRGLGGEVGPTAEHEHGIVLPLGMLAGGTYPNPPEKIDKPIIQAGSSVDSNTLGTAAINFPSPFPNGLLTVVAQAGDATGPQVLWTKTYSLSNFWVDLSGTGIVRINWIAIGW